MLNGFSNSNIRPSEVCHHLSYAAWQGRYLTNNVYDNLVAVACINFVSAITVSLSNALIVAVIAFKPQLRTCYNILLANLAWSDLLVGLLVQPLFVTSEIRHVLNLGPFCKFDTISRIGGIWIFMASFGQIVLISMERYIFIKLPLRYEEIVTKRRVTAGVITAWAVPTVLVTTMITLVSTTGESDMYSTLLTASDLLLSFIFLVYITVIICVNISIFLQARNHRRRLRCEQLPDEEAQRLCRSNKAAKTLRIILAALMFSYLPVTVFFCSASFLDDLAEPRVLYVVSSWCFIFLSLGSLFNPLIYCWRIRNLRHSILDILHLRQNAGLWFGIPNEAWTSTDLN